MKSADDGASLPALRSVLESWIANPDFRARARVNPVGALAEKGLFVPDGVNVRIVENTPEICHVTFPSDPNVMLPDEKLATVSGGIGERRITVILPGVAVDANGNLILG